MTTAAPASASICTIAAPMPREPPVTRAVWPRKLAVVIGVPSGFTAILGFGRPAGKRKPAAMGGRLPISTSNRRLATGRCRISAGVAIGVGLCGRSRPCGIGIAVAYLRLGRHRAVRLAVMTRSRRRELDGGRDDQRRTEYGENCLAHGCSPFD